MIELLYSKRVWCKLVNSPDCVFAPMHVEVSGSDRRPPVGGYAARLSNSDGDFYRFKCKCAQVVKPNLFCNNYFCPKLLKEDESSIIVRYFQ